MTSEEYEKIIKELEDDISYFKNIGFIELSNKFNRDLTLIKTLLSNK